MHNVIKEVFLIIMMTTLALILYWVFFGQPAPGSGFQGVLYWMCHNIEVPISQYYYNYCYLPNMHNSDYIDMELGCKLYGKTNHADLSHTDYNSLAIDDMSFISYPSSGHYSSGWF